MHGEHLHQSHPDLVKRLKRADGHLQNVIEMMVSGATAQTSHSSCTRSKSSQRSQETADPRSPRPLPRGVAASPRDFEGHRLQRHHEVPVSANTAQLSRSIAPAKARLMLLVRWLLVLVIASTRSVRHSTRITTKSGPEGYFEPRRPVDAGHCPSRRFKLMSFAACRL